MRDVIFRVGSSMFTARYKYLEAMGDSIFKFTMEDDTTFVIVLPTQELFTYNPNSQIMAKIFEELSILELEDTDYPIKRLCP